MTPALILSFILGYFGILMLVSWITTRKKSVNMEGFFLANRQAPWFIVAFGLISDSLSGVTFISVPGKVGVSQFGYMQVVFGYVLGYIAIAFVLLPLYYRLHLTSIYSYLKGRLGFYSHKTGAFFFLLSRLLGAAARLYLSTSVLQFLIFKNWNVPYPITVILTLVFIMLYSQRGGMKTLIWTDVIQSGCMLGALIFSVWLIKENLNWNFSDLFTTVSQSEKTKIFFSDIHLPNYFWKQFLAGAFICISMTGLDQSIMQKNLACRSLKDAQKNLLVFSGIVVIVNLIFVTLGFLLYHYTEKFQIPVPDKSDYLFPNLATEYFGKIAGGIFVIGLIAATFSSADSVLNALTTSVCVDILNFDSITEERKKIIKRNVFIVVTVLMFASVLAFQLTKQSAIDLVLNNASYTYGPLLGLFAFGLFTKRKTLDIAVPLICIASPFITYGISTLYKSGFEVLIINGIITFIGLAVFIKRKNSI